MFTKVFLRFFLSQFIEKYKPKLEEEKKEEDFKKRKQIFVAQVLLIFLFNIYC